MLTSLGTGCKGSSETRNKAAVARRYELASNIESGKWGVISVRGDFPSGNKEVVPRK
ncbi:hypothetical protein P7H21_01210 [Paenibacillus larvae]|nr:hypothetical protein [Paenibacillus larvae]MDT2302935.1 hypothetical protein [Paenibacillus larvae]